MRQAIAGLMGIGLFFGLSVAANAQERAAQGKITGKNPGVQRFWMNPYHTNIGKIVSVNSSGTVRVADVANPRFGFTRRLAGRDDLTEGYYLGLVADDFVLSTKDTRLIRVQVTDVGPQGSATLRISPGAASKIKAGEQIVFFRPPGSTTAEIKAAPDFAPVDDGSQTSVLGRNAVNVAARLTQSRNNLKQIGLAMHNFHDVYNRFPPAVVYGSDGKPWHSWRVLILPYIDQAQLYNRYRFNEPWNGPNNKKLLSQMPDVYRDPIYGKIDDYHTHYATVTGKGTAFPTEGVQMDAKRLQSPLQNLSNGKGASGIRDFRDGTSNSILIGSVSPTRKIPWMKPEDVKFDEKFPALSKKGSFATPYESSGISSGVFLFGDGSVRNIRSDINPTTFRNLLTIADGNSIGELPDSQRPRPRRGIKQAQVIEIIRTDKGVRARLVSRSID